MQRRAGRAALAVLGLVGLAAGPVTACGGDGGAGGTVTVFAAASLTDAFDQVAAAFEEANPGITVELNYAGSSSLRDQILAGAPADVFAAADTAAMDAVVDGDAVAGDPAVFATNEMQIAVPAGNAAGVEGLDDLGDEGLLVGLCAPEVPCGQLGREVLAGAGVTPAPDTEEPDVRSLLTKVAGGELDAGLVYATDVRAAGGDVEGIEIPEGRNVVAEYPIAPLAESGDAAAARAFVDFVLAGSGQEALAAHGFGPPAGQSPR